MLPGHCHEEDEQSPTPKKAAAILAPRLLGMCFELLSAADIARTAVCKSWLVPRGITDRLFRLRYLGDFGEEGAEQSSCIVSAGPETSWQTRYGRMSRVAHKWLAGRCIRRTVPALTHDPCDMDLIPGSGLVILRHFDAEESSRPPLRSDLIDLRTRRCVVQTTAELYSIAGSSGLVFEAVMAAKDSSSPSKNSIRLYSVPELKLQDVQLQGFADPPVVMACNGKLLASSHARVDGMLCPDDVRIRVWDMQTGECVRSIVHSSLPTRFRLRFDTKFNRLYCVGLHMLAGFDVSSGKLVTPERMPRGIKDGIAQILGLDLRRQVAVAEPPHQRGRTRRLMLAKLPSLEIGVAADYKPHTTCLVNSHSLVLCDTSGTALQFRLLSPDTLQERAVITLQERTVIEAATRDTLGILSRASFLVDDFFLVCAPLGLVLDFTGDTEPQPSSDQKSC